MLKGSGGQRRVIREFRFDGATIFAMRASIAVSWVVFASRPPDHAARWVCPPTPVQAPLVPFGDEVLPFPDQCGQRRIALGAARRHLGQGGRGFRPKRPLRSSEGVATCCRLETSIGGHAALQRPDQTPEVVGRPFRLVAGLAGHRTPDIVRIPSGPANDDIGAALPVLGRALPILLPVGERRETTEGEAYAGVIWSLTFSVIAIDCLWSFSPRRGDPAFHNASPDVG